MPRQTPSQTVGPFFSHALTPRGSAPRQLVGSRLADRNSAGRLIRIEGWMLDGAGDPVPDGMVEIWQADHTGAYPGDSRGFPGFGRAGTDADGRFWFQTVKPGPPSDGMAPHINVAVFARGMLNHAFTRIYFSDEPEANSVDPVLASVAPERRDTLIAAMRQGASDATYEFTICLQGDQESVFFDA